MGPGEFNSNLPKKMAGKDFGKVERKQSHYEEADLFTLSINFHSGMRLGKETGKSVQKKVMAQLSLLTISIKTPEVSSDEGKKGKNTVTALCKR